MKKHIKKGVNKIKVIASKKHVNNGVHRIGLWVDILCFLSLGLLIGKFLNKWTSDGISLLVAPFPIFLTFFSENKSVKKAAGKYISNRIGGIRVFCWVMSTIAMVLLDIAFPEKYLLPTTELLLIVPFILSLYLKSLNKEQGIKS